MRRNSACLSVFLSFSVPLSFGACVHLSLWGGLDLFRCNGQKRLHSEDVWPDPGSPLYVMSRRNLIGQRPPGPAAHRISSGCTRSCLLILPPATRFRSRYSIIYYGWAIRPGSRKRSKPAIASNSRAGGGGAFCVPKCTFVPCRREHQRATCDDTKNTNL